jgi:hypothetical protein
MCVSFESGYGCRVSFTHVLQLGIRAECDYKTGKIATKINIVTRYTFVSPARISIPVIQADRSIAGVVFSNRVRKNLTSL